MAQNPLSSNALSTFQVPRTVYNAIRNASATTGVNFSYMIEKAAVESNFNADAKAKTSSATGLYQFIESTWLQMVDRHGDKYGLEKYADKISTDGKVANAKDRREILELRKDPQIASYMAAEFASGNHDYLKEHVGGKIGSTELYMAHFLGAGGASGFLNAMKKNPQMAGADLFPREARANRNVFYDAKTGRPRTLSQIYAHFDDKFKSTGPGVTQLAERPKNGESVLRVAKADTDERTQAPRAQAGQVAGADDPFLRLAAFMNIENARGKASMAGLGESAKVDNWQIFPPSLYSRLSLSPAQMMMLSDFEA